MRETQREAIVGGTPTWINVGSGPYLVDNFINYDNSPFLLLASLPRLVTRLIPRRYQPLIAEYRKVRKSTSFVRHDCRKPLPLPDESVDHILCSHFLEHLYPGEARGVIADFCRVLRPGGTIHLIVPSLGDAIEKYIETRGDASAGDAFVEGLLMAPKSRPTLRFRLMLALGYEGVLHRFQYDRPSLVARVEGAGFQVVDHLTLPSRHVRSDDPRGNLHVGGIRRSA